MSIHWRILKFKQLKAYVKKSGVSFSPVDPSEDTEIQVCGTGTDAMNLHKIFSELDRLGYDRYRLDGDPLGTDITCSLFKPGMETPDVIVTASCGLQSLRSAVNRVRTDRTKSQDIT